MTTRRLEYNQETKRYESCCKVGSICGTYTTYLRRKAKERNLVFELSEEYLWELYLQQDCRCIFTGLPLTITTERTKHNNIKISGMTASLDRIDNNVGYIEGNVQWVHKSINRMRQNFTVEEFIDLCKLVVNHVNPEPSLEKGI